MDSSSSRVPCDFEGCTKDFNRQQDQCRHKREYHKDPKKCPWCFYTAKRDERLLEHIDEKHRPRKQKSRTPGESTAEPLPKQGETSRRNEKLPSQPADSSSIQGQASFGDSASGLGLMQPQNKRVVSQQVGSNFEGLPALTPQLSASLSYQAKPQVTLERDGVNDGRNRGGLSMRPRTTANLGNNSGGHVVQSSRGVSVKFEHSSSDTSPAADYHMSVPKDMSDARLDQFNQGAQQNFIQAFPSSQPSMYFDPTPLSSSSYTPETPFYEFSTSIPQRSQQSISSMQSSPSYNASLPLPPPSNPTYIPHSPPVLSHTNAPMNASPYPRSFASHQNEPPNATHSGQKRTLEFLDDEYENMNMGGRWQ